MLYCTPVYRHQHVPSFDSATTFGRAYMPLFVANELKHRRLRPRVVAIVDQHHANPFAVVKCNFLQSVNPPSPTI
jgi:hypothetical protein